jgi:acyl-CoA synthetase (AMP-forming)/AMP-acid ligase II
MRNELSERIFKTDLKRVCLSIDQQDFYTYHDLYDIYRKLNVFLRDVSHLNCRVGMISNSDKNYALYALSLMENSIYCPIDPKWTERQIYDYCMDAKIDVLFCDQTIVFNLESLKSYPRWTFNSNHDFYGDTISTQTESNFSILTTTSGTSAQLKLVPLYYESWVYSIPKYNEFFDFNANVKQLVYVHLSRIASLYIVLRTWAVGAEVIYCQSKNMNELIELLRNESITHFNGPTALFNSIVQSLKINNEKISRLTKLQIHSSGSSITLELKNDIEEYLNSIVYNNYGLTEVYYVSSTYKCDNSSIHNGQMIIDDYKIVDGELWIKGPQVFKGYENIDTGFEGEWFKTGDCIEFDSNGYCVVSGRVKEMINRGGEKISPYQIESLIYKTFSEIKQCIVFLIPNNYGSEDVACAYVSDTPIELKQLRSRLMSEIEAYKCPIKLYHLDEIYLINNKISRNHFYKTFIEGKEK